jgi:hypothetical protein
MASAPTLRRSSIACRTAYALPALAGRVAMALRKLVQRGKSVQESAEHPRHCDIPPGCISHQLLYPDMHVSLYVCANDSCSDVNASSNGIMACR